MKENIKQNYKAFLGIFVLAIIINVGAFKPGHYHGHDTFFHLNRIIGNISAIRDGQIIPTIAPNVCNGFGYSYNFFYGMLFPYISTIFSFFTNNVYTAMKLVIFVFVLISGITMYNFIHTVSKSKYMAFIVSVFYIFCPYKLSDIYTRYAVGEILAFAFFPLVFHGLYSIFHGDMRKHYLLTIGLVGVIYSHNLSTIMIVAMMVLYILINIEKLFQKEILKKLFINSIFVILISLFFYGPLIQSRFSSEYVAFTDDMAYTNIKNVEEHAIHLRKIFEINLYNGGDSLPFNDGTHNEMTFALGIFIWLPLLFTPFIYKKIPKESRRDYLFLLISGIAFSFISTHYFPWRFLMIASLNLSIIAGINMCIITKKRTTSDIICIVIIVLIYSLGILVPVYSDSEILSDDKGYEILYGKELFNEGVKFTSAMSFFDYLPVRAANNIDYISTRTDEAIIVDGYGEIINQSRSGTKMQFEVENVEKGALIELPYIYYIGYEVKLNYDNTTIKLEIEESEKGFVQISLPKLKNGVISVKYIGAFITYLSAVISLISALIFCFYCVKKQKKESRE